MFQISSFKNITFVLLKDSLQLINNDSVDVIYALDMFHQPRKITKQKISQSNLWYIEEDYEDYIKCKPRKM